MSDDQLKEDATSGGNDSKNDPVTLLQWEHPGESADLSEAEELANDLEAIARGLRDGEGVRIERSETEYRKNHVPIKVSDRVLAMRLDERVVVEAHVQYSMDNDVDDTPYRVVTDPPGMDENDSESLVEALDDADISLDDLDG